MGKNSTIWHKAPSFSPSLFTISETESAFAILFWDKKTAADITVR